MAVLPAVLLPYIRNFDMSVCGTEKTPKAHYLIKI